MLQQYGGNVGIGTTAPSGILHVIGNSSVLLRAGQAALQLSGSATSTTADIQLAAADRIDLFAGSLSLQTSSTTAGELKLMSKGSLILDTSGGTGDVVITKLTTLGYVCTTAGGVLSSGATCATSDLRLKQDVHALSQDMDVLAALDKLRGVSFTWDQTNPINAGQPQDRQVGMIAQEVEQVLPSLVTIGGDGYRRLDYAKLTGYLVEVAKAQQTQITQLREKLALTPDGNLTISGESGEISRTREMAIPSIREVDAKIFGDSAVTQTAAIEHLQNQLDAAAARIAALEAQQKTILADGFSADEHSNELPPTLSSENIIASSSGVVKSDVDLGGVEPPPPDMIRSAPHRSRPTSPTSIAGLQARVAQLEDLMSLIAGSSTAPLTLDTSNSSYPSNLPLGAGGLISPQPAPGSTGLTLDASYESYPSYPAAANLPFNIQHSTFNILSSATIGGTLTVGTTFIGDDGSISGLGCTQREGNSCTALAVQPLAIGNIDFLGGKIVMTKTGDLKVTGGLAVSGNVHVAGDATFSGDVVAGGAVAGSKIEILEDPNSPASASSPTAASIGQTVIPAGETEITIYSTAVTARSKIFVTPQRPAAIGATVGKAGQFTINLAQPTTGQLKVNWWIVN